MKKFLSRAGIIVLSTAFFLALFVGSLYLGIVVTRLLSLPPSYSPERAEKECFHYLLTGKRCHDQGRAPKGL